MVCKSPSHQSAQVQLANVTFNFLALLTFKHFELPQPLTFPIPLISIIYISGPQQFCSILMTAALQYQSNPICCKYPFIRQSQIMSHLALILCCFSLKLFPLNSLKTQDEREIILKRKIWRPEIVGGCGGGQQLYVCCPDYSLMKFSFWRGKSSWGYRCNQHVLGMHAYNT